jgi:hypothetical protein
MTLGLWLAGAAGAGDPQRRSWRGGSTGLPLTPRQADLAPRRPGLHGHEDWSADGSRGRLSRRCGDDFGRAARVSLDMRRMANAAESLRTASGVMSAADLTLRAFADDFRREIPATLYRDAFLREACQSMRSVGSTSPGPGNGERMHHRCGSSDCRRRCLSSPEPGIADVFLGLSLMLAVTMKPRRRLERGCGYQCV